jgi:hypothetical protein
MVGAVADPLVDVLEAEAMGREEVDDALGVVAAVRSAVADPFAQDVYRAVEAATAARGEDDPLRSWLRPVVDADAEAPARELVDPRRRPERRGKCLVHAPVPPEKARP